MDTILKKSIELGDNEPYIVEVIRHAGPLGHSYGVYLSGNGMSLSFLASDEANARETAGKAVGILSLCIGLILS